MKYKVGKSKIEGDGLFANKAFKENELIGLAHLNDEPTEVVGKYHNHSDNPNAYSVKVKNKRFIYALRDLKPGEEITVDYRKQPELEQPEMFKRGGQKKYTRDITAINFLNAEHFLSKKPKRNKKRIYSPTAKYYAEGGEPGKPDPRTQFYTVQGSDGIYRKVNGKWEVDWNRSGKFQPLSKGDVAKRTAILNSQAKPLYDPVYDDLYATQRQQFTPKPVNKPTPAKSTGKIESFDNRAYTSDEEVDGKPVNYVDKNDPSKLYIIFNGNVIQPGRPGGSFIEDKDEIAKIKKNIRVATQFDLDRLPANQIYSSPDELEYIRRAASGEDPYVVNAELKNREAANKDQIFFDNTFELKDEDPNKWDPMRLDLAKENSDKSIDFLQQWQQSPMYYEMLRNSAGNDFEYHKKGRDLRFLDGNLNPSFVNRDDPTAIGRSFGDGIIEFYPQTSFTDLDVIPHEYSHATDDNGRYIPKKDIELLKSYATDPKQTRLYTQGYADDSDVNKQYKYLTKPTETRARLNALRFAAKQSGVYDPFTQKVNPDIFKRFENIDTWFNDDGLHENTPLKDLKKVYTDEQIIEMLNTISKNNESNQEFNFAQKGGQQGDRFKKRLMKRYPGMTGVYGDEGENLNIVKDIFVPELNQMDEGGAVCPPGYTKVNGRCVQNSSLATFQDSLNVYNMQMKQNAYYDRYKNIFDTKINPNNRNYPASDISNSGGRLENQELLSGQNRKDTLTTLRSDYKSAMDQYNRWMKEYKNAPKFLSSKEKEIYKKNMLETANEYKKQALDIKKAISEMYPASNNKIYYKDLITGAIDPNAPTSFYDTRIESQGIIERDVKPNKYHPGVMVTTHYYDPIAIKPAKLLTDAEIKIRFKKYGAQGIPKSRLEKLGLKKEPTPTINKKVEELTSTPTPIPTQPVMVNPELKKFTQETEELQGPPLGPPIPQEPPIGEGADVMPVYDETDIEVGTPGPGGHWENKYRRYIDWDGNSITYRLPSFRKHGHYGPLLKKGQRHYIHFPSIEKRLDAWIEPDELPEEEYQDGGQIYTYAGNPNASYKKIGNQWYISHKGTGNNFVPIKDPEGRRAAELNKNAVLLPGQPAPVEAPRPVQGAPKPVINQTVWENAAGTSQKNAIAREKQLQGLKNSVVLADQEKAAQIEWQRKQQALAYQAEQEAKWRNEQPLDMMDWLWGAAVVGPTVAPAAWTAAETFGTAALPYLQTAFNTSLPGISIPGATFGNTLASVFAGDAIVNRLLPAPGKIQEGKYGEAAADITTGVLDLWGANMLSPAYKGVKSTVSELGKFLGTEEGLLSNTYKYNPFGVNEGAFHRGSLKNILPGSNPEFIQRGLANEEAINDLLNTGIVRNRLSAGLPSKGRWGENVYWGAEGDPLASNQFNIIAKNTKGLSNRPVTAKDIVDIQAMQPDGTYASLPDWQSQINRPHWLRGYKEVPKELPGSPNSFSIFPKQPIPLQGYDLSRGQAYKTLLPETAQEQKVITSVAQAPKEPWKMQPMPGLHLKSTMTTNPKGLHTQVAKDGTINVENALKFIKNNEGQDKYNLVVQALGENIPKKMDYNQFRKIVQDQLIPLETQVSDVPNSAFGLHRISYNPGADGVTHYGSNIDDLDNAKIIENKTLVFSNKDKFGLGSDAHSNSPETLGHVHYFIDDVNPDALTISQIQADAFQGPYRVMPKNTNLNDRLTNQLARLKDKERIHAEGRALLEKQKIERLDANGDFIPDHNLKYFEEYLDRDLEKIQLEKSHLENITQKFLLDKNHSERYLQEIIDYAAKRGDINRIKLPTPETANSIQNYTGVDKFLPEMTALRQKIIDASESGDMIALRQADEEYNRLLQERNNSTKDIIKYKKDLIKELEKESGKSLSLENWPSKDLRIKKLNSEITILEKYKEYPKMVKKLYGIEPKIITDSKGNTWYEFNIPKEFKEGLGEIKAFRMGGDVNKLNKFIS